jgi:hypothetical protein
LSGPGVHGLRIREWRFDSRPDLRTFNRLLEAADLHILARPRPLRPPRSCLSAERQLEKALETESTMMQLCVTADISYIASFSLGTVAIHMQAVIRGLQRLRHLRQWPSLATARKGVSALTLSLCVGCTSIGTLEGRSESFNLASASYSSTAILYNVLRSRSALADLPVRICFCLVLTQFPRQAPAIFSSA